MPERPEMALVVSCVDLKAADPVVRMRDVPSTCADSLEDRFGWWVRSLQEVPSESLHPVRDLYRGVAWNAVRQIAAARDDLDIWVLSAGLGLVPLTFRAPSYGATFTGGAPDSVGASRDQRRQWWLLHTQAGSDEGAGASSLSLRALAQRYTSMAVALSASYFDATRDDVMGALDLNGDTLLVTVGSTAVPFARDRALRLPAGARGLVGGTLVSLLNRALLDAVTNIPEGHLNAREVRRRLESLSDASPPLVRPLRTTVSDEAILRYIARLKLEDSGVSASAALTRLRADGFACEQARFRRIFGSEALAE
jgi:hypothetical protein